MAAREDGRLKIEDGKAARNGVTRPTMRVVNRGVSVAQCFFLKAVFVCFPFPAVRGFQNVIPACELPAASRCSSYYPCMTRSAGQHIMTFAVLARKRARPIYRPGRCQPKGATGARRFKLSFRLHQVSGVRWFSRSAGALSPDHLPAKVCRFSALGFPTPQIHRHLPRDGHNGFLARSLVGFGLA